MVRVEDTWALPDVKFLSRLTLRSKIVELGGGRGGCGRSGVRLGGGGGGEDGVGGDDLVSTPDAPAATAVDEISPPTSVLDAVRAN